ncbi:MAG: NAD-dependent epimerase/dehydratase family protein, partial [Nitrosopumilus sp. (ex Thoosa mismalolli)]|nr:NAD-dependent epimerase/dehydratase family protein [Nitrosopumilus sp. (ex Thoosa mismalolli)]
MNCSHTKPYSVFVSGATGFIGSRLVSHLTANGVSVCGLSRKLMNDSKNVKYVQADVFDLDELTRVMDGVEIAYYLLHSMEGDKSSWQEFAS